MAKKRATAPVSRPPQKNRISSERVERYSNMIKTRMVTKIRGNQKTEERDLHTEAIVQYDSVLLSNVNRRRQIVSA